MDSDSGTMGLIKKLDIKVQKRLNCWPRISYEDFFLTYFFGINVLKYSDMGRCLVTKRNLKGICNTAL